VSSAPTSRIRHIAFWLWVGCGVLWIVANWSWRICEEIWFPYTPTDSTFRYVNQTPEEQFRECLAKVLLWCLFLGPMAYGAAGVVLFRRYENGVITFAVALGPLTWLAWFRIYP
jgi:hypothetical protein